MVAGKPDAQTVGEPTVTVGLGFIVNVPVAATEGHRGGGPLLGVITTVYTPATVGVKVGKFPGLVAPAG